MDKECAQNKNIKRRLREMHNNLTNRYKLISKKKTKTKIRNLKP